MTDEFGNRIPANQHPRKLPALEPQGGGELALLGFACVCLLIVGMAATAVMAFAKIAVWAWA